MDAGLDRRRGAGVALWRQIQQVLEREIAEGIAKPGDRLPTEFELAERFQVNRHTVRRALAEMEDKGLLRVEQGRGTFVHEHVIDYALGKRTRFASNLMKVGREAGHEFIRAEAAEADGLLAEALGIRRGAPILLLEAAGMADGRIISFSTQNFPADRFPGIDIAFRKTQSITASLARYGVEDYTRKWTRVVARMPTGAEADALHQPRNRPVLVTEALDVDKDGRPVNLGITRFASDWVQLVIE